MVALQSRWKTAVLRYRPPLMCCAMLPLSTAIWRYFTLSAICVFECTLWLLNDAARFVLIYWSCVDLGAHTKLLHLSFLMCSYAASVVVVDSLFYRIGDSAIVIVGKKYLNYCARSRRMLHFNTTPALHCHHALQEAVAYQVMDTDMSASKSTLETISGPLTVPDRDEGSHLYNVPFC